MHLLILCLGLFFCVNIGDCVLTWNTPSTVPSGGGDAGVVAALDQTAVLTALYTLDVTSVSAGSGFVLVSQDPVDIFSTTITISSPTGTLQLASTKVLDYQTSTAHVLKISATDGTDTETATITLSVRQLIFSSPLGCVDIPSFTAAGTRYTATTTGAHTKVLAQVGTTTGYTFDTSTGIVANAASVNSATTDALLTVTLTATESHGTSSTATQVIFLCIKNGCTCSGLVFGGAPAITAGLLSVLVAILMTLK